MDDSPRICAICGCRVRNPNQKVDTCSSFCTDAKKAGLTYSQAHERATAKESEIHPITAKSCVPPAWRQPIDNGTYKVRHDVTE